MNLMIVPNDNIVVIDGVPHEIDLSSFDLSNIQVVRFSDDSGVVEYNNGDSNKVIHTINPYLPIIDAYNAYVQSLQDNQPTIEDVADAMRQAIELAYQNRLSLGFISNALGYVCTYDGDNETQTDLMATQMLGGDRLFPCADEGGVYTRRMHTHEQLVQVLSDGFDIKQTIKTEKTIMLAQVQAALDADDAAAIHALSLVFSV